MERLEIDADRTGEHTRLVLSRPQEPPVGAPDYNVAPTKQAAVVLTRGAAQKQTRQLRMLRMLRMLTWGLVPAWAKDTKTAYRMINARAETLFDKGAYAKAASARRCLVPASGWYEWQASPTQTDAKGKPRKQPFFTRRADDDLLAFAGLYEFWRDHALADDDPDAWLVSFTIITTAAEPGLDRIHDRQPVVLDRDDWATWLDPAVTDPDDVRRVLTSQPVGRFEAWPVSTAVSSSRSNGPGLIEPVSRSELHGVVDPETGEVLE